MGVIYKLEPEVIDFILEKKKSSNMLSCRQISGLILDKFNLNISKSSVNAIIKNAGLSLPVGRHKKARRRKPAATPEIAQIEYKPLQELESTGTILLRAADYLIGGSLSVAEMLQTKFGRQEKNLQTLIETLIYLPLSNNADAGLTAYIDALRQTKAIGHEASKTLAAILPEVRCIKVALSDGSALYLDGQLHTIWSMPRIPYSFSAALYNVKKRINRYFNQDSPFVLFMAPGYDAPTKEFLDFILGLDGTKKTIFNFSLCDDKLEELENIGFTQKAKSSYLFGLWPWQFVEYRKVKISGDFRPYRHEHIKESFYLADVEVEITLPKTNQALLLKGCALKRDASDKTRFFVLGNASPDKSGEEMANIYLSRWPNIEEAFRDYSRKIELFTYTADSRHFHSPEEIFSKTIRPEDIKNCFEVYLQILDLFVRQHLLPLGYENKDLLITKEQFYALNVRLDKQKGYTLATFTPPSEYRPLKDLEYACRRLNEKEATSPDGQRLWCCIA